MAAKIIGVGGFVPPNVRNNEFLTTVTNTSDAWIVQRTGIKERRILDQELATSDMIVAAIQDLLSVSTIQLDDVDCVIVATCTPDMPMPSTANIVCSKLKMSDCLAFDLNSACTGFIYALSIASSLIESGRCNNIIIAGADTMSKVVNIQDRSTNILFGDGAGVVLLQPTIEKRGIIDATSGNDGEGVEHITIEGGGSQYPLSQEVLNSGKNFLKMNGKIVFRNAVERMTETCNKILSKNGFISKDVDWVICHQANLRIINAVRDELEIDAEKILVNVENFGNTTAASIPLCLWEFQNNFKQGDLILLTAFGAGFTWGSVLIEWSYN